MTKLIDIIQSVIRTALAAITIRAAGPIPYKALISATCMSPVIRAHRHRLIKSQVIVVSLVFAVLALLWGIVDFLVFPMSIWGNLFAARGVVSVVFLMIAVAAIRVESEFIMLLLVGALMGVLSIFFFFCRPPESFEYSSFFGGTVLASYSLMPFVIFAGLSLFPFTLIESAFFMVILLGVHITGELVSPFHHPLTFGLGSIWIMTLLGSISVIAGLNQLKLIIAQITLATHDRLTGCLGRMYGAEALEILWSLHKRRHAPFSVAFIDLDHFKKVNDTFGHTGGDEVLANVAHKIRDGIRESDLAIRWGGEEFLVVMPNTDTEGAKKLVARLYEEGFGVKPDNTPQTASTGIAERTQDHTDDWQALVNIADKRLYLAKTSGRNRYIATDDDV